MKNLFPIVFIPIIFLVLLAFSANPPNARTGAPGEGLCTDCHSPGSQSGSVFISGVPATILPGETYSVSVTSVTTSGSNKAGFQVVVLN